MSENNKENQDLAAKQADVIQGDSPFTRIKDKGILFAWITGLLLLISLLWILTTSLQSNILLRNINSIFVNNEDARRVSKFIPHKSGKADLLGYWYSMLNSNDKMFVFGVFQDGILVPLGAIVSEEGSVKEVLPLSAHASQIFSHLPKSILQMYINRIEENKGSGG